MRQQIELQRAHDMLTPVVSKEIKDIVQPCAIPFLSVQLDTICWMLEHHCHERFGNVLTNLESHLKQRGWHLPPLDKPTYYRPTVTLTRSELSNLLAGRTLSVGETDVRLDVATAPRLIDVSLLTPSNQ